MDEAVAVSGEKDDDDDDDYLSHISATLVSSVDEAEDCTNVNDSVPYTHRDSQQHTRSLRSSAVFPFHYRTSDRGIRAFSNAAPSSFLPHIYAS